MSCLRQHLDIDLGIHESKSHCPGTVLLPHNKDFVQTLDINQSQDGSAAVSIVCIKPERLSVSRTLHLSALAVFLRESDEWAISTHSLVFSQSAPRFVVVSPSHFHRMPSFSSAKWPQTTCCVPWLKKPFPKLSHNVHVLFCFVVIFF